jgi:hypothetical protein
MSTPSKTLTLKTVLANEANISKLELGEFEGVELPAFEALSQRKHYLNLSGIQKLSDEEAAVFGRHPGILDLSGLKELSDTAITQLAAKKGGLWLNGLTAVSETAAEALSKHEGDLYLWGVKKLPAGLEKALKRHNVFLGSSDKT